MNTILVTISRVLLASVLALASISKFSDLSDFAAIIIGLFTWLPQLGQQMLVVFVPSLEMVLGVGLLLAARQKEVAAWTFLLFGFFAFFALFRWLAPTPAQTGCGCFGSEMLESESTGLALLRNVCFLLLSIFYCRRTMQTAHEGE